MQTCTKTHVLRGAADAPHLWVTALVGDETSHKELNALLTPAAPTPAGKAKAVAMKATGRYNDTHVSRFMAL